LVEKDMARITMLLAVAYAAAYVAFRAFNTEVWAADGKPYVIFPEGLVPVYYAFRPLSYLDNVLTGMGAHIGPHR
jgi:hypothetical protein